MNIISHNISRFQSISQKKGFGDALEAAWQSGVVKPFSARLGYAIYGRQYPVNILFVVGLAKSGSSWFENMICELEGFQPFVPKKWPIPGAERHSMDVYPGMFEEFHRRLAVLKGHTCGCKENIQRLRDDYGHPFCLTVRDPRDTLISGYWYKQRYKTHWDYKHASTKTLSEYIEHKMYSGEFESEFLSWIRPWIDNRDEKQTLLIRYEDLLSDTFVWMKKALKHLRIDRSDQWISDVVAKHSFKNITGRDRGDENRNKFVRKGVSGEWQKVYSPEQQKKALQQGKDVFTALGYIS
jgi:hypothetical protein